MLLKFVGGGYRKMQVNLVRPQKGHLFHRLGELDVNMEWSLKELRHKLNKEFKNVRELKDKRYVFIDSDFNNLVPHREEEIVVRNVFKSYVKVKILHGTGKHAWE